MTKHDVPPTNEVSRPHILTGVAAALTFALATIFIPATSRADLSLQIEGGALWQAENSARVPGNSGTKFNLTDFGTGPVLAYRAYLSYKFAERHEIRALYAPLAFDQDGEFKNAVSFQGTSFAAGVPTSVHYKFNSYRLTYAYHFEPSDSWQWSIGFTAKIRDAEVGLSQGGLAAKKTNVGFVPLLNVQARYFLLEKWNLRFDLDGMAAPQGRAIDFLAALEYELEKNQVYAYGGYRTIEGGADNDEVYNFAWLNQAVAGISVAF